VASRAVQLAKKEPAVKREPDTDEGLVFTSTGEFVRGISLDEIVKKEKNELFDDDEEMKDAEEPEADTKEAAGGWTEVTEEGGAKEEDEEEKVESISEEVIVGSGVAGALKLLQQRGALSETVDWGGRNMDKKKGRLLGVVDESLLGMEKKDAKQGAKEEWPREVQLIRHDRFGRVMTPKEAWRELNHHFHGMYPSKNKKEKEFKQFMEEKKLKQMNSGDTPAGSVQKMREVQAKTASPYIVLSGSVKPGQTSDFRSGFAVAEKETFKPGELTPMLGDQKVSNSLDKSICFGAGSQML
jgi:U4/U6.U5 tri-snRNP-associated protein 1